MPREAFKATAMHILGLLLGGDISKAIQHAFVTDEFAALLDVLPAAGNQHIRTLYQGAFEQACSEGRVDSVVALLPADCVDANRVHTNPDGLEGTPLQLAVCNNQTGVVQALVASSKVHVNADTWELHCPLAIAADKNHVQCLRILLGSPQIDVNAQDELDPDGYDYDADEEFVAYTVLSTAVKSGSLPCVQALLAADGIDINKQNRMLYDGEVSDMGTALFEVNREDVMAVLLAADGIAVNRIDGSGATVWHMLDLGFRYTTLYGSGWIDTLAEKPSCYN